MASDNTSNISDIRPGTTPEVSPTQLPIRGEKRVIPSPINSSQLAAAFKGVLPSKTFANTGRTALVQDSDFNTVAALEPFVDYVIIRIMNRATSGSGTAGTGPAVYRFLINPNQVQIQRTTLDGQAMTRAGWQIGVWGEDSFTVNLSGKTAGQYFAFGTTDTYQPFTESYRNLLQLQMVFENNGYWFEGEQAAEGPLAAGAQAGFTRRRIKMHADVELIVGNFMWYGMFDTLTISQDADSPFLMSFQISFTAWKEEFRSGSPYNNLIINSVERGHSYTAWQASSNQTSGTPTNNSSSSQQTPLVGVPPAGTLPGTPAIPNLVPPSSVLPIPPDVQAPIKGVPLPVSVQPVPSTVQAAQQRNTFPEVSPVTLDSTPPPTTQFFLSQGFFNG